MTKRFFCLLFTALLLALLPAAALAAGEDAARLDHVTDTVGLLTDTQRQTLERRAAAISEQHGCSVYIVTVEDYNRYGYGVIGAAEHIFEVYDLGWGETQEGVMLLLSMAERDYALICHGYFGNEAFTEYGRDKLAEYFKDDFREDDWYSGLYDYLEGCDEFMTAAEEGHPVERNTTPIRLAVVIVVPLVVAFAVCSAFKRQMKTARLKTEAGDYVPENGMNLRVREDIFTHRTEHRERIESSSSSGSGSSSGGGGFSGSSGKF